MRSTGACRASAATWVKTVLAPCPISVEAARTRTWPSAVPSRAATELSIVSPLPVNPPPCMNTEKPTPRLTGSSPALRVG